MLLLVLNISTAIMSTVIIGMVIVSILITQLALKSGTGLVDAGCLHSREECHEGTAEEAQDLRTSVLHFLRHHHPP